MIDNIPALVIVVSASPFNGDYHRSAREFCLAAIALRYSIHQVFFYGDGSLVANRALGDDDNHQGWIELAQKHDVPLRLCVTTAQNRGILDSENADYMHRSPANLAVEFEMTGLAQFFDRDPNMPIMHFKG